MGYVAYEGPLIAHGLSQRTVGHTQRISTVFLILFFKRATLLFTEIQ